MLCSMSPGQAYKLLPIIGAILVGVVPRAERHRRELRLGDDTAVAERE